MPAEQRPTVSRRKLGVFGVVAVIAAGLIVATGIRAREEQGSKLKEWTDNQAIPTVAVALPSARALNPTIELPGRLEAYYRAPIFARVSGYLKSWSADIGARVKAGQVMAEWDPFAMPIVTEVSGYVKYGDIIDGVTMQDSLDEVTGLSRKSVTESKDADLIIIPKVGHIRWDETRRANELLQVGYEAALQSINAIKSLTRPRTLSRAK